MIHMTVTFPGSNCGMQLLYKFETGAVAINLMKELRTWETAGKFD